MIAEIGHLSLIIALSLSLIQGTLPLIGAWKVNVPLMSMSRSAAAGQFIFISLALACLMYCYVTSDFSVKNVFENSHSAKPLIYKFTAVWGNHEGSMVLWVWILAFYGIAIAGLGTNLPPSLRARVLAIQGLIGMGFLVFLIATSNPFLRLDPAPLNGRDLNPLLQDPGLAFHPPLLYFGYVGLSVAFSFAVAALIEGKIDPAWARWVRPWTLLSWSALTAGIILGSWWAYYELGWGGFWLWDPDENASFMPWLMATALLHSAIVAEKRDALKNWTVLLAILGFSLSLMGTFLVRSGMLTSVHSFAADPARGVFILGFLIIVIGGALSLYAWRAPNMKASGRFRPISREGALVINNLLLVTGCASVLIGTLYPLVLDAISGTKVSVGPPFFESSFVWSMAPLILLAAAGPLMSWKRADVLGVGQRLIVAFGIAALTAILLVALKGGPWGAILGLTIATWLIAGVATEFSERIKLFRVSFLSSLQRAKFLPRSALGMSFAHAGLAILIAGAVGATNWQIENVQVMKIGESVSVAGYDFTLSNVTTSDGPNYTRQRGEVLIKKGGKIVDTLYPEKRKYWVQGTDTTEAAIRTTWLADIYVAIGDPSPGGGLAVRIYYNPLVPWIWLGALIMVIGGIISLTDRKYRIGAPKRSTQQSISDPIESHSNQ